MCTMRSSWRAMVPHLCVMGNVIKRPRSRWRVINILFHAVITAITANRHGRSLTGSTQSKAGQISEDIVQVTGALRLTAIGQRNNAPTIEVGASASSKG